MFGQPRGLLAAGGLQARECRAQLAGALLGGGARRVGFLALVLELGDAVALAVQQQLRGAQLRGERLEGGLPVPLRVRTQLRAPQPMYRCWSAHRQGNAAPPDRALAARPCSPGPPLRRPVAATSKSNSSGYPVPRLAAKKCSATAAAAPPPPGKCVRRIPKISVNREGSRELHRSGAPGLRRTTRGRARPGRVRARRGGLRACGHWPPTGRPGGAAPATSA